jgi:AcrR family transcriptional regulator
MGKDVQPLRREQIIRVATHLMSKKGYEGASLQEIASQVGIHKSTLFHYFRSKEEILLVALGRGIEEVTINLEEILDNENLDPEEKLRLAILNHLHSLVRHIDNVNIYNTDLRSLSPRNMKKYLQTRKYYQTCLRKLISNYQESEMHLKGLNTRLISFAILGMCNWVAKWYKDSGPFTVEEIADCFFRIVAGRGQDSVTGNAERNGGFGKGGREVCGKESFSVRKRRLRKRPNPR